LYAAPRVLPYPFRGQRMMCIRDIPDAAPEAGQKAVALFAAEKPGIDPGSKTKWLSAFRD